MMLSNGVFTSPPNIFKEIFKKKFKKIKESVFYAVLRVPDFGKIF